MSLRLPLAVGKLAARAAHLGVQAENAFLRSSWTRADHLEGLAMAARKVVRKAVAEDLRDDEESWTVSRMTGFALRNAYATERAR